MNTQFELSMFLRACVRRSEQDASFCFILFVCLYNACRLVNVCTDACWDCCGMLWNVLRACRDSYIYFDSFELENTVGRRPRGPC